MEELKELFGGEALTYAEFETKLNDASSKIKLANLKNGSYVDSSKFEKVNQNYKELNSKYEELVNQTKDYAKDLEELATLRTEKANAGKLQQIADAKIDKTFTDFVLDQVNKTLKDGDKFEDVLKVYVKEHPQYLSSRQGAFLKGSSTVNLENGSKSEDQNSNQIMNDIIRNRG